MFAALDIAAGKVIGKCRRRHRQQNLPKFMDMADSTLPADAREIVLDNSEPIRPSKSGSLVLRHPRYQLHFTPASGSWVNQIERWFA